MAKSMAVKEGKFQVIVSPVEMLSRNEEDNACGNELGKEAKEDMCDSRLDCIYDDGPLGFEKPLVDATKMEAQDPLEEVDLGDGSKKMPTYISSLIDPELKGRMIELLKEFRDCFAWDYDEMPGLSRNLVELQLPIKEDRKPVKQLPRRFHPDVLVKIKEEIERLLRCKFIRAAKYVEWLANVVPVIKKNGKMRVCIDFRDLNAATPKDEYHMPIAEMMVYIDGIVVKSPSRDEHLSHLRKSFERMRIHGLKMNPLKCAFGVIAGDFLGFVVHKKDIEINKNKAKAILDTSPPTSKKQLQSLLGKVNFLRRFIANLSDKTKPFSSLLRLKREDTFRWEAEHQKAFDELKTYLANPPVMIPPIKGKPMRLYISATDETIGSLLAQEDEDGIERAIFYLSRVLNDAETRYTMIEKLSLTEYSLTYAPLKAIKGQAVADFLADHTLPEEIAYVGLQPWKLFFDGSSHREGSGIGMLIVSPQGIPTKFMFRMRESCSNNEAEYEALVSGLEVLLALGAKNVEIKGDSELVVKQLTKEYKCVSENLAKYYVKAMSLLANFDQAGISYIPRLSNQEANELAQIASGYMIDKLKLQELIRIKEKFSPLDLDVMAFDNLTPNDWRNPIDEYLQNPVGSTDRKVKYRALIYTIIGNELFKKNVDGTLLKCLNEDDAFIAVSAAHDGLCGAHQAGAKMKWMLFRQGMYWPTIMKDCIEYARGYQDCQKHSGIQHVSASELHSIIKP
ncbi:uncharacterized protein LOC130743686 [Lotus japonicus]|uniref:uncharacterized protein LOC130743686 n=1 Tax=Lotus japonicus TaxID=34305 RepID=UPI0025847E5F|nr:uncharacterized protein LOC130743686 [Lotus japonicus]